MKRVVWAAVAASAALLAGCNSPHLALGQDSAVTVPVGGTYVFSGLIQDADGPILWKLDGPGSISDVSGTTTTYTAPATYDPSATKATLVASLSDAPDEKQTTTITIAKPSTSSGGIPGLVSGVTVTYDERDIPTIKCTQSVDCYAVLGFIHARDRFFQMDLFRRSGRGTVSELVGDGGLEQDLTIRTLFTNRKGEFVPEALAVYNRTDDFVASRVNAYTAGVNAWIATLRANPSLLPAAYGQLVYRIDPTSTTDLPDWSDVDTAAVARLQQFLLSEDVEKEQDYGNFAATFLPIDPLAVKLWIRAQSPVGAFTLAGTGAAEAPSLKAGPPAADAVKVTVPAIRGAAKRVAPLQLLRELFTDPAGSNNWVVDGAHSATGQAIVANDPHLSLTYPSNFHLSHLIGTEDQLNVMGAIFPGLLTTLIGRGTHVGWGATVVGYDVTDLYVEHVVGVQQGVPIVEFNGQQVPLTVVPQVYRYRTSAGLATLPNPQPVLVSPKHGPVVFFDQTSGLLVSARWTGQETQTDDIRAFLRLNNAASVDDARHALEGDSKPDGGRFTGYWVGAQNFVLADDQGNIGYVPHACVPQRPWAVSAAYPYPVVPVPGTGPFEWSAASDGGIACVPDELLPRAFPVDGGTGSAKGYLATANFDPLGASKENNPYNDGAHPGGAPYLSFDWDDPLGFRIQRIQDVLDAKTATGGKVGLQDLQALQSDHVLTAARPFVEFMVAHVGETSDPNAQAAIAFLGDWGGADAGTPFDCPTGLVAGALDPLSPADPDAANSDNSARCLLFHTFLRRVLETTFADEAAAAGISRNPGAEVRALLTLLTNTTDAVVQAAKASNSLCSDVDGTGHKVKDRTCTSQVLDAIGWAYGKLTSVYGARTNWRWGQVHTVTFKFAVSGYPLVDPAFQPGPYPRPGGAWTVDVGLGSSAAGTSAQLSFPYGVGGNVRWLAAMDGTVANTFMQLPGVESGGPYPFGKSTMLTDWVQNKYFNWPFNAADVTSVRIETFSP
jgi:Protein related to penicillin acylase